MGKKRTKQSNGPKSHSGKPTGYYSADSQDEIDTCCSESDIQSVMSQDDTICDIDTSQNTDALRENIAESINLMESRTTSDREKSLKNLCAKLSNGYMPDVLENWQETLCTLALRCLSKGKRTEAKYASNLLFLLLVQFGPERMASMSEEIRKALLLASNDVSHSMEVRGTFLHTLALCSFFNLDNQDDEELLTNLETVICGTMRKEVVPLVAQAFEGWCVLAIQFRPERVVQNYEKLLLRILKIFEEFQDNKELRLSAGKMVALIYEVMNDPNGRTYKKFQKFDDLYDLLNELSRQGSKVVNKKDKKVQKSSLREAISFMDGDQFRAEVVKFGKESLPIGSYSNYILYDTLKDVLGTGMNKHLSENPSIRDIFDLKDMNSNSISNVDRKQLKNRMKGEFTENDKQRTLFLKKQRDKRTDQSFE